MVVRYVSRVDARSWPSLLQHCRHASVGTWSNGKMIGYTSRGLGVGDVPLHFKKNCGEVSILTLRRFDPRLVEPAFNGRSG